MFVASDNLGGVSDPDPNARGIREPFGDCDSGDAFVIGVGFLSCAFPIPDEMEVDVLSLGILLCGFSDNGNCCSVFAVNKVTGRCLFLGLVVEFAFKSLCSDILFSLFFENSDGLI